VRAEDLNARFKELLGDQYSVKDLRTWHGTVLAAEAFAEAEVNSANAANASKTAIKRAEAAVMRDVAEALGNTPAVARASYVDPRVIAGYEQGTTIAAAAQRAARVRNPERAQAILEKGTRMLIRRLAKA
jgi:DNA topoisomerase IB